MKLKASLGALILAGLVAVPARADIIRNKSARSEQAAEARGVVRDGLDRLGVDGIEAKQIVQSLRPEEARFFAGAQQANAVVAGLWVEEWIGAAIYIVLVGPNVEKNIRKYVLLDPD